ncbi:hypothetical protein WI664_03910 [Vibrio cholerae]
MNRAASLPKKKIKKKTIQSKKAKGETGNPVAKKNEIKYDFLLPNTLVISSSMTLYGSKKKNEQQNNFVCAMPNHPV